MMRAMSRKKPCPLFSEFGDGAHNDFTRIDVRMISKIALRIEQRKVGSGVIDDYGACFRQGVMVFNEPGYADCRVNEMLSRSRIQKTRRFVFKGDPDVGDCPC